MKQQHSIVMTDKETLHYVLQEAGYSHTKNIWNELHYTHNKLPYHIYLKKRSVCVQYPGAALEWKHTIDAATICMQLHAAGIIDLQTIKQRYDASIKGSVPNVMPIGSRKRSVFDNSTRHEMVLAMVQ